MAKHHCGICKNKQLSLLWDLPKLPLTECFGAYDPEFSCYDQELMICDYCGHVQLDNHLEAEVLYTENEYSYRTANALSTPKRIQSFVDFSYQYINKKEKLSIVDIGGNDQALLNSFGFKMKRTLVDPRRRADDGMVVDGVNIIGRFIEEINLSDEISPIPNVIVCTHTLEHIQTPYKFLEQLAKQCSTDCLFIFEVPCLENMVKASRFDGFFHQHLHYFSLHSLTNLIEYIGGSILGHAYNSIATMGGSIMIAFRFDGKAKNIRKMNNIPALINHFNIQKSGFQNRMNDISEEINGNRIYGFGASLMLPTLLYHLNIEAEAFHVILDDDSQKNGWQYKNLNLTIIDPKKENVPRDQVFMVTSLENAVPIANRIKSFSPRKVLLPMVDNFDLT